MKEKIQIRIGWEDEGRTVAHLLKEKLKLSRRQISSLKFRPSGILCNGVQARTNAVLRQGDLLEITPEAGRADPIAALHPGVEYQRFFMPLFENDNLLVINKRAGVACHPAHGHYDDTLANALAAYWCRSGECTDGAAPAFGEKAGRSPAIRIVGRLDKDTSGIVLIAKNKESAADLQRQQQNGELQKTYLALACGDFAGVETGRISLPLQKDPHHLNKMRIAADEQGMEAETLYRVIATVPGRTIEPASTEIGPALEIEGRVKQETGDSLSLLEVKLRHGRTHQIRLHLSHIGHPLVGDPIYGWVEHQKDRGAGESCMDGAADTNHADGPKPPSWTALHAWKVTFRLPFTQKMISVEAPLPEWVDRIGGDLHV